MERFSFVCVARRTLKRCEKEKKRTAKTSWIHRQWNDPYVKQARRENLRSRAAFKLRDLNKKFDIIRQGDTVLDLGAAPGGWTQIAAMESCGKHDRDRKRVIAVDLVPMQTVEGASIVTGDFRDSSTRDEIGQLLEGRMVDVVLSDMAPHFTGHFLKDSQQQLRLCYNALLMAELYLKVGGNFVTKVLQSEDLEDFRGQMKVQFKSVKGFKPASSRSESTELFFIGKEYRGNSE